MHLSSMVEMIDSAFGDRVLLGDSERPVTGTELATLARAGASTLSGRAAVVYVGENHPLLPVALFAAAWAGMPFVPVNYRLDDAQLNALVGRHPDALVLADTQTASRVVGVPVSMLDSWLAGLPSDVDVRDPEHDDDEVAVVLYTSGTTQAPRSVLLRHRHLMAYLLGTVEFGGASDDEVVLVSVPSYHVAGIANMLSNTFAGRRIVYLRHFDPKVWLDVIREERVTNAMVVPTMLARIVHAVVEQGHRTADVPSLKNLSYGGAKISERVLRDALKVFPKVGFVNAYGLTETASTIAVLGPEAHRAAVTSDDHAVQARLRSVGQVLPTIDVEVRDEYDQPLPPGQVGLVHVRGEQISGEYATGSQLDELGWFCTNDRGWLDADGYLFIEGRADDTIIRGGENIAPAEIEEVLLTHPAVAEVCVVGIPDDEWGHRLAAVVVLQSGEVAGIDELQRLVRTELRGSKTPETIVFRDYLPHTDTGKVLRRIVQQELSEQQGAPCL